MADYFNLYSMCWNSLGWFKDTVAAECATKRLVVTRHNNETHGNSDIYTYTTLPLKRILYKTFTGGAELAIRAYSLQTSHEEWKKMNYFERSTKYERSLPGSGIFGWNVHRMRCDTNQKQRYVVFIILHNLLILSPHSIRLEVSSMT